MWAWLVLVVSGLFEAVWATNLARITSWRDWQPISLFVFGSIVSVGGLYWALRHIPVGTGYAVWTGVGAVTTVVYGIAVLGEAASWPRLLFLSLIIIGIVGLQLVTSH